jgi:hypothetical protein
MLMAFSLIPLYNIYQYSTPIIERKRQKMAVIAVTGASGTMGPRPSRSS